MYTVDQIIKGFKQPVLACREINKRYYSNRNQAPYNSEGIHIFSENWDNLIILDACRYDLFKSTSEMSGDLTKKTSRGSHTAEFLKGNFSDTDLMDTIYVTASPMLYRNKENLNLNIFKIYDVWKGDGWDEESGTVLPQTVTKKAIKAINENPDKRLVVHYLQPHYPFISSDFDFDTGQIENEDDHSSFWRDLATGDLDVDMDTIWRSYRENLKIVLKEVVKLDEKITGKTVITSDHGNMIGERSFPLPIKEYGHPFGTHTPQLVEIPWLERPYESRRTTAAATAREEMSSESTDEQVKEKLESLGYI